MASIHEFIAQYQVGDYASIVGLAVSAVGFVVTIIGVWRSKSAAQEASMVARQVREDLGRTNAVAEFAAAISAMSEIKTLPSGGGVGAVA
jgi:hypothetical protein